MSKTKKKHRKWKPFHMWPRYEISYQGYQKTSHYTSQVNTEK